MRTDHREHRYARFFDCVTEVTLVLIVATAAGYGLAMVGSLPAGLVA